MTHYDEQRERRSEEISEWENKKNKFLDNYYKREYSTELKIPSEFSHITEPLRVSALKGKYPANNWLEPDGKRSTIKEYHDSIFHHLARSFAGIRNDSESGLDHLLHVACNAMMLYTRLQRGIEHPDD